MSELVNHPSHYNKAGRKECIVEMEEKYGSENTVIFCLTNAYKYLYRSGDKDGNPKQQDLQKATWYFDYANRLLKKHKGLWNVRYMRLYKDIMEMLNKCES